MEDVTTGGGSAGRYEVEVRSGSGQLLDSERAPTLREARRIRAGHRRRFRGSLLAVTAAIVRVADRRVVE